MQRSFMSLLFAVLVCAVMPAGAATINVTANAPDVLNGANGSCALREAITNVNDGADTFLDCTATGAYGTNDTINLPAGTYTNTISGPFTEDLNASGDLDIHKSVTINGSSATSTIIDGGGTNRVLDVGSIVSISNVTIRNGSMANGAGIKIVGASLTIANSIISGNHTPYGSGGGIYSVGLLTIINCIISGNTAREGGGINNQSSLTITNSTISGNTATNGGGGIFDKTQTFSNSNITNSIISGNSGGGEGGGIDGFSNNGILSHVMNITNSTISGNSAYSGGGISSRITMNITNSTISGNSASGSGGGIYNRSTLNGGMLIHTMMTFTNSTITDNSALGTTSGGGGILNSGGIINLKNTIVAKSNGGGQTGGDCIKINGGTIPSPLNSLDSDNTCGVGVLSNQNPLLGPLVANGGPTQTHALLPGSPAIDAGDAAICTTTDQRGVIRPQGLGCDVGAYESGATPPPPPPPTNTDIAVTKTTAPNPVQVGNNLTYTLIVTNNGPSNPATGVTLTDTLPVSVTFVSATSTQGACNVVGGTVTCNIGNVPTATTATISIIVTPAQSGQITNTATVAGNETDLTPSNNTAQAVTTVNAIPPPPTTGTNLAITKIDTPDPVIRGQNLSYIIQVTNNGPDAATGVTVVDPLPTGVTFSSAASTQGACSQSTGTLTCNVGALANGTSATITLVIIPTSASSPIINTTSVAGNETDPISGNNAAQAVTTVISAPPLTVPTVTLGLNSLSFATGSTLTLTGTTVAGVPPTNADIYLALQLPDGTLFVMQPGGTFGQTLVPVLSNIQVPDFTGSIFNYTFTGLEPSGTYTWFAALAQPGTFTVIGTLTQAGFTFAP